jgi:hypothetical protein
LGEKGVDYCMGCRGGMLREKGKLYSVYAVSPSVTFFWNTFVA